VALDAQHKQEGDVALGISHSGSSVDVVDALAISALYPSQTFNSLNFKLNYLISQLQINFKELTMKAKKDENVKTFFDWAWRSWIKEDIKKTKQSRLEKPPSRLCPVIASTLKLKTFSTATSIKLGYWLSTTLTKSIFSRLQKS
jgi:hypothetical protein